MQPWRRAVAVSALGLVLAAGLATPLSPARADDLNDRRGTVADRIAASQQDLESLDAGVAKATASLLAAQRELPAARAQLSRAQAALTAARQVDQALGAQLAAARDKERTAAGQVTLVQGEIADTHTQIGRFARTVYQQGGGFEQLAVVLEAQSPDDLTQRLAGVRTVFRSQNAALGRLSVLQADLAAKQQALAAARADVEARKQQSAAQVAVIREQVQAAAQAKVRIDALVAQRASALGTLKAGRANELARLAALKAEQRRIQQLIAARAAAATARGPGVAGRPVGGELVWPSNGPMVQGVGPRIHPVYGYKSCHTGIDIASGYGATIVAAAAGVVVDTSMSGPFGMMTIVDHGGGLSTMYAHQSARSVTLGQRVAAGQPIGSVGATGWVTGPHLHFEVHVDGVPYDPMGWFGGAKRPVVC